MRSWLCSLALGFAVVLGGCLNPSNLDYALGDRPEASCPGHWHVTLGIYLPAEDGEPKRVDFAAPLAADGVHAYYDFEHSQRRGAPLFAEDFHMHQSGEERNSTWIGASQLHLEWPGKCVSFGDALHRLEVDVSDGGIALHGGHEQVPGQSGTFPGPPASPLAFHFQTKVRDCVWEWTAVHWDDLADRPISDGESYLVVLGNYTTAEIEVMMHEIHVPTSRAETFSDNEGTLTRTGCFP